MLTSSAYFVLGIPLSWYLSLHLDMGIPGLWYGPTLACFYLTLSYNIYIGCIDWDKLFVEIEERRVTENEERDRLLRESLEAQG